MNCPGLFQTCWDVSPRDEAVPDWSDINLKHWANVSYTPFRKFKHYVDEGGISTPLIAHRPKQIKADQIVQGPCHVVDILPAILQVTGSQYLTELNGREIQSLQGESLLD